MAVFTVLRNTTLFIEKNKEGMKRVGVMYFFSFPMKKTKIFQTSPWWGLKMWTSDVDAL